MISSAHGDTDATARSWPTTMALWELGSCEWHWLWYSQGMGTWLFCSSLSCHEFQTIHSQVECVCTIWCNVFFRWVVMCCWIGFLPYHEITALCQWYFCHCAESWIILKVLDCGGCWLCPLFLSFPSSRAHIKRHPETERNPGACVLW